MGKKRDVRRSEKKSEPISVRLFTGHKFSYRWTFGKKSRVSDEANRRGMTLSLFLNDLAIQRYEREFGFKALYNDLERHGYRNRKRLQELMLARRAVRRLGCTSEERIGLMAALLCKGPAQTIH